MTLDDMACELAAALRDAIEETDSDYIKRDPEDAFVDLACRLILRLRGTLTVVPSITAMERARITNAEAAGRIFEILTRWMHEHPGCSYDTRISASGRFQIIVKTPTGTHLFFGQTVQDAYAQAAQALALSEGTL
jgi:hypothetical protein